MSKPEINEDFDTAQFIEKVNGHIAYYKNLTADNAREIIDYIKKIIVPLHIRITFEHLSCLTKLATARSNFEISKTESRDKKRAEFHNINKLNDIIMHFRFALSTIRHKGNFHIPFVRHANGLMFIIYENPSVGRDSASLTCQLLATPANEFNPKFNQGDIADLIRGDYYDIYPIRDGTTINMYYDPYYIDVANTVQLGEDSISQYPVYTRGRWVKTTKHSFNLDMSWRGYQYDKVVADVLRRYKDFDVEKLDKNKTYSIGFKHPAFHPFLQPREWDMDNFDLPLNSEENKGWVIEAWFIQSYDMKTQVRNYQENIGLPLQERVTDKVAFAQMLTRSSTALADYIKEPSRKNVLLGFILRSRDEEETKNLSDILLESSLWLEIRKSIYHLPYMPDRILREKQEQNFKNMIYLILESFLDIRKHNIFIRLFPQFQYYYQRYEDVMVNVIQKMHEEVTMEEGKEGKMEEKEEEKREGKEGKKEEDSITASVKYIVNALSGVVSSQYQTFDRTAKKSGSHPVPAARWDKKTIRNIIAQPKYTDIFYQGVYRT